MYILALPCVLLFINFVLCLHNFTLTIVFTSFLTYFIYKQEVIIVKTLKIYVLYVYSVKLFYQSAFTLLVVLMPGYRENMCVVYDYILSN